MFESCVREGLASIVHVFPQTWAIQVVVETIRVVRVVGITTQSAWVAVRASDTRANDPSVGPGVLMANPMEAVLL